VAIELAQIRGYGHQASRTGKGQHRRASHDRGADCRREEQFAAGCQTAIPDFDDVPRLNQVSADYLLLASDLVAVHVRVAPFALPVIQAMASWQGNWRSAYAAASR
jgi:hypothetical protein